MITDFKLLNSNLVWNAVCLPRAAPAKASKAERVAMASEYQAQAEEQQAEMARIPI